LAAADADRTSLPLPSRIYSLKVPQAPIKVIALSDAEEETLIINRGFVGLLLKRS